MLLYMNKDLIAMNKDNSHGMDSMTVVFYLMERF